MIIITEEKSIVENPALFKNYGIDYYTKHNSTKTYIGNLIDGRPLYQISNYDAITLNDKEVIEKCIQYCTIEKIIN